MNIISVTLQKISWASKAQGTSGSTWASSNRKPQRKCSVFGSDKGATISVLKKGVTATSTSDDLVTVWLNYCTDEEAQLYRAEYGETAFVDMRDESNPQLVADYPSDVATEVEEEGTFAE